MIDFHCHLDLFADPHTLAEECRRRGLYVLSVTTTPSAWQGTQALSREGDRIRTAVGLHPQAAHERGRELTLFDAIVPRTRYVGEIGLDGSPELRPHWQAQVDVFDHILASCARAGGKIMSLHSRRAAKHVLDRLEASPNSGTPILHWFSGSARELDRAIGLGCWFSVGPAMLAGEKGRALAAQMPKDRVLTESDGPFAQVGGATVMPWQVELASATLASLWSVSHDHANTILHGNLRQLIQSNGD